MRLILNLILVWGIFPIFSQDQTPEGIKVKATKIHEMDRLPDIQGTNIYAGKKNEVIHLDKSNANLILNNARQVFAKVPGLTAWENDGSGIQTSIATRGLSPNRSWEFNNRLNGYDLTGDPFGYPEAYFTPPLESVEKVEIIRGAGALQYGPQFGGMINYVLKKGDASRPFRVETRNTGGSYNTINTYTGVGGTVGKWNYYTFYQARKSDGWRDNSEYTTQAGHIHLGYQANEKLSIAFEFTKSNFLSQQPGGLTDLQFKIDPRQSSRQRNWLSVPINIPSFNLDYKFSDDSKLNVKIFGFYGERSSVANYSTIDKPDTIDSKTLEYSARRVDIDWYRNAGIEARQIFSYQIWDKKHHFSFGARYSLSKLERIRNSNGSKGTDFDMVETNLLPNQRESSLVFGSRNIAGFAENLFQITDRLSFTPGVRYEYLSNQASGTVSKAADGNLGTKHLAKHNVLYGAGIQFKLSDQTNLYANYTRAYRPVTYSELYSAGNTIDDIDPNLKDQTGYNADTGFRGRWRNAIHWDVGVFKLRYNNRVGRVPPKISGGNYMKTNIGDSLSQGVEAYIELDPIMAIQDSQPTYGFSIFGSGSSMKNQYVRWDYPLIDQSGQFIDISKIPRPGNTVENSPTSLARYGITFYIKNILSISVMESRTSSMYSDSLNTVTPNTSSTTGLVDAFAVKDFSLAWTIIEGYTLRAGINNFSNEKYYTRRAGGLPGPGILPGDGIFYHMGLSAIF